MKLRTFENRAFLILVALVTLAFLWMVRGFLMPVFWAAVLAVLFRPIFVGWNQLFRGRRNIAAGMTVLSAVLIVIIPLAVLGVAVTNEAIALLQRVTAGDVNLFAPLEWAERQLPAVTDRLDGFDIDTDALLALSQDALAVISQWLASQALVVGQNALEFTIYFGLMLYVLYFFVRDGDKLVAGLIDALPLGDARERRLFERFEKVSFATVKGTLIVASVQGAIGGFFFWILGIQGAIFWGVVMAVLSLLPAIGTVLVWGPAAIILMSTGEVFRGVALVLAGVFIIGIVDNILRPILIGRETHMPDYLVLLATLGGLARFGLSGFVLGPMLAAFFLVVWEMFKEEFKALDKPGAPLTAEPDPDVPGPGDALAPAREEATIKAEAKLDAKAERDHAA